MLVPSLVGAFLAATSPSTAQSKTGIISFNELLNAMPEFKKADTTLAEYRNTLQERFEAYQKIGFLQRSDGDWLYDPRYDDAPNAWITTTFIDGQLAGRAVYVLFARVRQSDPAEFS